MNPSTSSCITTEAFSPLPYEVDFSGFLSNTVAPCWLERLRVKMMREHFGELNIFVSEHLSVIASTEIRYLRPIRLGDELLGKVWVEKCLRSSWRVQFCFTDLSTRVDGIRASQVGVFIDAASFQPVRVPPLVRKKLTSIPT